MSAKRVVVERKMVARWSRKLRAVLPGAMIEVLEERLLLASTFIPLPNLNSIRYDDAHHILYAGTTTGLLRRYDTASGTELTPITVGGALYGFDITPDGGTAYLANAYVNNHQGTLFKVDLSSGSVTTLNYPLGQDESGPLSVAIADNGHAFVTTNIRGGTAGAFGIREIDLASDTITGRSDYHTSGDQYTLATRSADRSAILFQDSNSATGQIALYRTATNQFLKYNLGSNLPATNLEVSEAAFSRDDNMIAIRRRAGNLGIMDASLASVKALTSIEGAMAFDPVRDVLYGINVLASDEVIAYDTNTWREKYRLPLGQNLSSTGEIVPNAQGTQLFVRIYNGVLKIDIPQSSGDAASMRVEGFPSFVKTGATNAVTVRVLDAAGDPAANPRRLHPGGRSEPGQDGHHQRLHRPLVKLR